MKFRFLILFGFFLLLFNSVFATDWITNDQSGFDEGTHSSTEWSIDHVQLTSLQTSGTYTSKIFDAGISSSWDNITWASNAMGELPGNKEVETKFAAGNADMTGNVLLMHMDESSGTIVDNSGEGNDGTVTGGITYEATGKLGTALDFDGTSGYVDYGDSTGFDWALGDDWTYEFWAKVDASEVDGIFISQRLSSKDFAVFDIVLGYNGADDIGDGEVGLIMRDDNKAGLTKLDSNTAVNDGEWHHIAVVRNTGDDKFYIYIDGIEKANVIDELTAGITTDYRTIGVEYYWVVKNFATIDRRYLDGAIDEVAIYSRALSSDEILNHYKRGALKLDLNVRSCDDANCDTESWTDITDTSPQSLSISNNRYFQYKLDFSTDDSSYTPELHSATAGYTILSVCGASGCEVGEDITNCPEDCCESDGTATDDTTCHSECNGYNNAVVSSGCDSSDISGGSVCASEGYCNTTCTYNACSGCYDCSDGACSVDDNTECDGTEASCGCSSGTCQNCSSGYYCTSYACTACSTTCDNSCQDSACYETDTDCTSAGGLVSLDGVGSTYCCGNTICEGAGGESCENCADDCGACPAACGDGTCQSDENKCTCPVDCGSCSGDAPGTCKEYSCVSAVCSIVNKTNCCGNAICEAQESASSCATDCALCDDEDPCTLDSYDYGKQECVYTAVTPCCGDGTCEKTESCSTCPDDCGECPIEITVVSKEPADLSTHGLGQVIDVSITFDQAVDNVTATLETESTELLDADFDLTYKGSLTVPELAKGNYNITFNYSKKGIAFYDSIIININPELKLNLLTNHIDYIKSDTITINGSLTDLSNNPVADALIMINLTFQNWIYKLTTRTDQSGNYKATYLVRFADPDGEWTIQAGAIDNYGNTGLNSTKVKITIPAEQVYAVRFYSPISGSKFYRGQTVTVTIEVTKGGEPISDADVNALSPSGVLLNFTQQAAGLYTTEYKVPIDEPLGTWSIGTQAIKKVGTTTEAGGDFLNVGIKPLVLVMKLLNPTTNEFDIGSFIDFKLKVTYPDGTELSEGTVKLELAGESLLFFPEGEGIYSSTFEVKEELKGTWDILINAKDLAGNSGLLLKILKFKKQPWYVKYMIYIILLSIVAAVLISGAAYKKITELMKIKNLNFYKDEVKRINKMKSLTEDEYFHKRIDEETYLNLMRDYEAKLIDINSKISVLESKLKTKIKKKKIEKKKEKPKKKEEVEEEVKERVKKAKPVKKPRKEELEEELKEVQELMSGVKEEIKEMESKRKKGKK